MAQLSWLARPALGVDQGRLAGVEIMTANRPPKELVRAYLDRRTHEEDPPPILEEIRRQLGWHLIPGNGAGPEVQE